MTLLSSVVDLAIESLTIGMGPMVSVEDIVLKNGEVQSNNYRNKSITLYMRGRPCHWVSWNILPYILISSLHL